MKVLVAIKRVPDYEAKIKIKADGSGVETAGIKWIVNPFDEIAVEEAIRLKEAGTASEVVVVSVGPEEITTQLRYAMAMGADSGVLVKHAGEIDSDLAARLLSEVYKRGDYGLIILGKQSIDSDASQTGQLLAARLALPQACFASKLVIEGNTATVTREIDGGLETIKIGMPAVITTDLRLNEPRYAPLPGIMKAKKKPLEIIEAADLGVELTKTVRIISMQAPSTRQAGRQVADVAELIAALRDEAKLI